MEAVAEKPKKTPDLLYRQPPVEIGQNVWWYPQMTPNEGNPPTAAIVVGVGIETINVQVIGEFQNRLYRDGVRHIGDPRIRNQLDSDRGTWEHTPEHKRILALEELIAKKALSPQPEKAK